MTTREWTEEPSLYPFAGTQNAIPVPPVVQEEPKAPREFQPITKAEWNSEAWHQSTIS